MDETELFQRMGLAIAIGAMIGVERHWREREAGKGQRTAGLRTFTLIGMFGGVAALIEIDLARGAQPGGAILATLFAILAIAITAFEYRQSVAEGSFSVWYRHRRRAELETTVVATRRSGRVTAPVTAPTMTSTVVR